MLVFVEEINNKKKVLDQKRNYLSQVMLSCMA